MVYLPVYQAGSSWTTEEGLTRAVDLGMDGVWGSNEELTIPPGLLVTVGAVILQESGAGKRGWISWRGFKAEG